MLDIRLLRHTPELVKASQIRRHADPEIVDKILDLDKQWREHLKQIETLKSRKNRKTLKIAKLINTNTPTAVEQLKAEVKQINKEIDALKKKVEYFKTQRDLLLWRIPNIVDPAVPDGLDEMDNVPIRYWGRAAVYKDDVREFEQITKHNMNYKILDVKPESHVDLLEKYNIGDMRRAGKVAGARFYYIKNDLLQLELALELYALEFLKRKGFEIVEPPFMLTKRAIEAAADFTLFEDTLYKIENENLYLIATSEHAIAAMYMDEILDLSELPKKIAGLSPCFRKEAGAHGKDTKGIFRVHQFNKVEQFVFCTPDESEYFFNHLISNAEELYQTLELPYRVVNICAGDLGNMASIKYDIEVWMPAQGKFREVVSCSNLRDYQARRLNIRVRDKNRYYPVHTLNSTAIATTRTLVAIMENYQTDEGIAIPRILQKYTNTDFIAIK